MTVHRAPSRVRRELLARYAHDAVSAAEHRFPVPRRPFVLSRVGSGIAAAIATAAGIHDLETAVPGRSAGPSLWSGAQAVRL